MISTIIFLPNRGVIQGNNVAVSNLGIQLLGVITVTIYTFLISWFYFFPMKRLKLLKVNMAVEVLGMDTINDAESKNIPI
jgi:ammonia channel protein AmtB